MRIGYCDRLRLRLRKAEEDNARLQARVEELESELEEARQAAQAAGQQAWNALSDRERAMRIREAARLA